MVKMNKHTQMRMEGFTLSDIEKQAIKLLQLYEPIALQRCDKGYIVGFSGGKDSDALVELFFRAGVKHHIIHNHTTMDAPETVYYIRKRFAEFEARGQTTEYVMPHQNAWSLCESRGMLPTRMARFCCEELKERKKEEYRFAVYSFGVRWAESAARRATRSEIEASNNKKKAQTFRFDDDHPNKVFDVCYSKKYVVVNPLLTWTDDDVWEYLTERGLNLENMNPLYKKGWERVGCVGCPLSHRAKDELEAYPKVKALWLRTCENIATAKKGGFPEGMQTGAEYYDWWVSGLGIEEYLKKRKMTRNDNLRGAIMLQSQVE